nr:uncharacterized protein LOC107417873 [Ziziphus jujuba var. spinosa]
MGLDNYGLETLLRRSHVLHFSELQGVNNIVYELDKKGFQELKRLYLKGNDKIRYLINTMEHFDCSAAFASLESLSLVSLTKLEKISDGELVAETFKRLSIIKASECERLKNLLPFSIATQLEEIEIKDCQMMEEIVTHELNNDEQEEEEKIVDEFPHLCSLYLENVTKLRKFCSKMKKTPSQNEEEPLIVDSTMPFFDGKFVSFPKLEELKLSGCNFTKIWDDQFQLSSTSFRNLTKLAVQSCNFMKNLFSSAVAVSLEQLCFLDVSDCRMMEETMARNESTDKMSFPKLNFLKLNNLPNLVSFSSGIFIEFPVLDQLYIEGCPAFETFISNTEHNLCTGTMPSLFNEKQAAFPSLNEVVIESMDKLRMIWQYDDEFSTASSFCKLKYVKVRNCENLMKIIPSSMQRRLHNVRHLGIYDCNMVEEVFEIQMSNSSEETYHAVHAQLTSLSLFGLAKLKFVWSKDPPATLTFPNLEKVVASECPSLESIFPPSIAKGLDIRSCGIEGIVAKEEGSEKAPPEFVKLFPSEFIQETNVSAPCDTFPIQQTSFFTKIFNLLDINMQFYFHEEHELAHHDIPNQLQPLFSVEKVGLGTPRMMMISQDQLTAGIFGELKEINVYDCKSLTKMFSSNILRRLHNLSKLVICNCEMMEEVFEIKTSNYHHHDALEATVPIHLTMFQLSLLPKLKHVWSKDPRGTFTFRYLQVLNVSKCQSLKILFPTSVAKNLLRLQSLDIRNCGIEQIVAKEEGQDQAIPMFVFPQLNALTLHNLPQLMCFYPGLHALRLPLLRWLQVSYFMKAKDLSLKFLRFQDTSRLIDHEDSSFHEPLLSIDKVPSSSQCEDPVGDQEECAGTLSCLSGLRLYDMPNLLHLREESSQPQTNKEVSAILHLIPKSGDFENQTMPWNAKFTNFPNSKKYGTTQMFDYIQLQKNSRNNCRRRRR